MSNKIGAQMAHNSRYRKSCQEIALPYDMKEFTGIQESHCKKLYQILKKKNFGNQKGYEFMKCIKRRQGHGQ